MDLEKQEDVTVFWDFSSTQDSSAAATISTSALVKNICSAVSPYGPLKSIQLYWDYARHPIQSAVPRIRSELSASGVCLIDCPAEGRKDGAMKKMLVDLIIHAWDHEAGPHTYVIITTDRDVAYALSRLRMKDHRIILLSPSVTHADLASQATIQLDWTSSILGLSNFEDTPAATSGAFSAAAGHQRHSPQRRTETQTTSNVFQESDEPPLPNPAPERRSSSPILPHTARTFSLGTGPAPLPSAWYTPRPRETGFDPFNEHDEWPLSSLRDRSAKSRTSLESTTLSTESCSSGTRFSFVNPTQPLSTVPTSAEEEPKVDHLKPRLPTISETVIPGPKEARETVVPKSEPIPTRTQIPTLPPPLVLDASLPTINLTSVMPGKAMRPSVPTPLPSLTTPQMWNPLIRTLRQHGGTFSFVELPAKLLKSYPGAYALAGRSKYTPYIQLAVESGIVERINSSVRLTAAYR